MQTRWLVLTLLLAPFVLVGAQAWQRQAGTVALMPAFAATSVAKIEMAAGRDQVVLGRRLDTGRWEILSAADAPGDSARIAATIERLRELRGKPLPEGAPPSRTEPLEVRLQDAEGRVLGHAAIWPGEVRRLPDGLRLAIAAPPALPLWPSAWSTLAAPKVPVGSIAQVERLTPAGPVALGTEDAVRVAALLESLSAKDFVAGSSVNWMGASLLRVRLADGNSLDLQQVSDGDGRFHLRLTSDTLTQIRATRHFAFRVSEALP
ncbi:MAG: hypothetical protein ACRC1J_11250 [Sandaracinobacteroides sp.]